MFVKGTRKITCGSYDDIEEKESLTSKDGGHPILIVKSTLGNSLVGAAKPA